MPTISVPDAWRQNYPHFIAEPKTLRPIYVVVVFLTLITFIVSCIYYYQVDKDTIIELNFFAGDPNEWDCKSIGIYNGEYTFLNRSISYNLSETTSLYHVEHTIKTEYGGAITTTLSTKNITTYTLPKYPVSDKQYKYEITWGNAPTVSECLSMLNENICDTIKTDASIDNINIYKLYFDFELINASASIDFNIDISSPNLYNTLTLEKLLETPDNMINFHSDIYEYFIVSSDIEGNDNLCDIIDNGIQKGEFAWGVNVMDPFEASGNHMYTYVQNKGFLDPVPPIDDVFISFECALISDSHCFVDATKQFTFTAQNPLPTNTRMRLDAESRGLSLLLGPDLGTDCAERWQSICEEYYDFDVYCETAFAPPYTCTQIKNKPMWAVISLSYASCQLVMAVLIVLVSFGCKMYGKPVNEDEGPIDGEAKEDKAAVGNDREMLEMQQKTQKTMEEQSS